MKLNLGCSNHYVQGWVNVDQEHSPYPKDLELDLTKKLPWEVCSVTSVYAGHVLEHLRVKDALMLLMSLRECVIPTGQIMVVGPDVRKAEALIAAGTFDATYHTLQTIMHGENRYPGDQHQWECTTEKIIELLIAVGWDKVIDVGIENVSTFWPVVDRKPPWQLAVLGEAL